MSKRNKPSLEDLEKLGTQEGAEEKIRTSFWSYFKKNKSKLRFGSKLEILYEWLISGKLRKRDKLILIGALIYFLNPIDAIFDPTPFLGFLDDMGVIMMAFRYLQNRALDVAEPKQLESAEKPPEDK